MGEILTEQESELLEVYDSRYFGFLRLTEPIRDNLGVSHKLLLTKGIRYHENILIQDGTHANPNVYCKLGHLHLLLEDYVKALSAYQKFFSVQGDYWKDAPFLYGLGIVYFHYGAYMWTIKAFQQVLYLDPGFTRSNEIHLKLGMMFKMQGNYEASMKHFHQALLDSHPCSLSKYEIQFHIGHLYEMQNKCQKAQETYEAVIQSQEITNDVKSNVFKQLGWMHYMKEQLGSKSSRLQTAVQYLQKAIETDSASGTSWYLLGRCYAVQGKVHDAFTAYRHAIDKSDASADTWCSIGVLYQQQNQPMDALQAYVCAVQLDPYHAPSWTDLGILYEACGQPLDAVKCYNAAKRCGASSPALDARIKLIQAQADLSPNLNPQKKSLPLIEEAWKMPIPAELISRTLKNTKQSRNGQTFQALSSQHSPEQLASPSLSQQQPQQQPQQPQQQPQQLQQQSQQQPQHQAQQQLQQQSQQQLQHQAQQQQHPPQQQHRQQQLALPSPQQQQHENQHHHHQSTPSPYSINMPPSSRASSPFVHPGSAAVMMNGATTIPGNSPRELPTSPLVPHGPIQGNGVYPVHSANMTTTYQPSSTPPPAQASSNTNSHFQNTQPALMNGYAAVTPTYPQSSSSSTTTIHGQQHMSNHYAPSTPTTSLLCEPSSTMASPSFSSITSSTGSISRAHFTSSMSQAPYTVAAHTTASSSVGTTTTTTTTPIPASLVNFQIDPQTGMPLSIINSQNCAMSRSTTTTVTTGAAHSTATTEQNFENKMSRGMLLTSRDPVLSALPLVNESTNPPSQPLTVHVPSTTSMSATSPPLLSPSLMSPDVLSPSRHYSLLSPSELRKTSQQGIGLSGLGSVKVSLLREPGALPQPPEPPLPPCPVEKLSPPTPSIRVETKAEAYSPELQNLCLSPSQPITVVRGLDKALGIDLSLFSTKALLNAHADHEVEVRTQKQQLSDENVDEEGRKAWLCESSRSYSTITKYAQYQATTFQESLDEEAERNLSDSDSSSSSFSKRRKRSGSRKIIRFGTNCDLSDEKKWKPQFVELSKLPPFLRVFSPGNMLSHVDHVILGMNSVQLYMKIPGCRTPGHQENLNFSSVNINIGPGDCEWFTVPTEYWGVIHNLCEKNNVDFLMGSWWPILEDLYEERVPVNRFVQKPGDLVWVNAGAVHWVQAIGWCNNVAWNVGPFTEYQYNMAVERYEWNKLQGNRSIVPMILLSWNLARNIKISEEKLYEHIRSVLARVLKYCQVTLDCLKDAGVAVTLQRRTEHEAAHYCCVCEIEVFNILFVTDNKKHQVHCQDCARKTSETLQGFVVLQQFPLNELYKVYNEFKLYQQTTETTLMIEPQGS